MKSCDADDLNFALDKRPFQPRGPALIEQCLSAALAQFLEKGYAACTLEDVAFKSGITRMTFYRRFGDKGGLFRAVIAQALEQAAQPVHGGAVSRDAEPRVALIEIVERLFSSVTQPVTLALRMAMAEKEHFPDLAEAARAATRSLLQPVVDYLAWANRKRKLSVTSPERAAAQLTALAFSANFFYLEKPIGSAAEHKQWAEEVVDSLMNGWTPRRSMRRANAARQTSASVPEAGI